MKDGRALSPCRTSFRRTLVRIGPPRHRIDNRHHGLATVKLGGPPALRGIAKDRPKAELAASEGGRQGGLEAGEHHNAPGIGPDPDARIPYNTSSGVGPLSDPRDLSANVAMH